MISCSSVEYQDSWGQYQGYLLAISSSRQQCASSCGQDFPDTRSFFCCDWPQMYAANFPINPPVDTTRPTSLTKTINTLASTNLKILPTATMVAQTPLYDAFNPTMTFDISTHTVSDPYTHVYKHLKVICDIQVTKFHQFITDLRLCSIKVKGYTTSPHDITNIESNTINPSQKPVLHNLLTDYHKITNSMIADTRTGWNDDKYTQNAQAMWPWI